MKRSVILFALIVLFSVTTYAQKPVADIKPAPEAMSIKMPEEYSKQLDSLQQQSKKLATDNASLVSAWQEYVGQQKAIQTEVTKVVLRAALASRMTVEQLDNSDLKVDDKGNYSWVIRPKAVAEKEKPQQ